MSVGEFGMVVEITAQILWAFHQKGNTYHCIQTFHVIQLLMEYVWWPKFSQLKDSNYNEIFKNFISSGSEIPSVKWQKLFGDFVPKEYVPRSIEVFATVSHQLSQHSSENPLSTEIFYTDFNSQPAFPPDGYSTVSLCLQGTSKLLLCKLASLLEAHLQTCICKLLDADIDVVPDVIAMRNFASLYLMVTLRRNISKAAWSIWYRWTIRPSARASDIFL